MADLESPKGVEGAVHGSGGEPHSDAPDGQDTSRTRVDIHEPSTNGGFPSEAASPLRRLLRRGRRVFGFGPAGTSPPRIALYSQGMIGFGHARRNATIAHALRHSTMRPVIMMIAEAWQAASIPLPPGVDCVTLPGIRKRRDGTTCSRSLEVSDREIVELRARVIRSTLDAFQPDVLIVDHQPLGAAGELAEQLLRLHKRPGVRCVLGLRDVLQDRVWADPATTDAMRAYYHAIWVYGDPAVYDPVRELPGADGVAARVCYTGYLDQSDRLTYAEAESRPLLSSLPPGPLAVCVVGGGRDGFALAETFIEAALPEPMAGVLVSGPFMSDDVRERLRAGAQTRPRKYLLNFLPDPLPLIRRADRVIAMGGYNTVCEVLSFDKHALIVPRVDPEPEQWIRAQRMRELGLIDVLHPDRLSPEALTDWLARDLGPRVSSRDRIDLNGLARIPELLAELLAGTRHVAVAGSGV